MISKNEKLVNNLLNLYRHRIESVFEDSDHDRSKYEKARGKVIKALDAKDYVITGHEEIPDWMIIDSFRYVLGRRSYQVDVSVKWLVSNWDTLSNGIKEIIKKELDAELEADTKSRQLANKYFKSHFPLGSDYDRNTWLTLKDKYDALISEKKSRDQVIELYVDFLKSISEFKKSKKSEESIAEKILKNIKVETRMDDNDHPCYNYISEDSIPKNEKESFGKWMDGQTVGITPDRKTAYYVDDYVRWKMGLKCID